MSFNVIEWFALIFSVAIIVKIFFIALNPKGWFTFAKHFYGKASHVVMVIEFLLALGLFYYLLRDLTIVQIASCIVLGALLTGMTFAAYGKETLKWGSIILKNKKMIWKAWLPILIWLALALWILIELF